MATAVSIAIRKRNAIDRIAAALSVDTVVQGRDMAINDAVLLERIADAAERVRPASVEETAQAVPVQDMAMRRRGRRSDEET